jgi:hypothetical protein
MMIEWPGRVFAPLAAFFAFLAAKRRKPAPSQDRALNLQLRSRYRPGVIPNSRRNARVKLACDEKFSARAMSASG